jgi:hypothetical protein
MVKEELWEDRGTWRGLFAQGMIHSRMSKAKNYCYYKTKLHNIHYKRDLTW